MHIYIYTYTYMYIYTYNRCLYVYMYIYIYIHYREREKREIDMCVYIYIYTHIHVHDAHILLHDELLQAKKSYNYYDMIIMLCYDYYVMFIILCYDDYVIIIIIIISCTSMFTSMITISSIYAMKSPARRAAAGPSPWCRAPPPPAAPAAEPGSCRRSAPPARRAACAAGSSAACRNPKSHPTPDFRISPGGRKRRKPRDNEEEPGGRNPGMGISSWLLGLVCATSLACIRWTAASCERSLRREASYIYIYIYIYVYIYI